MKRLVITLAVLLLGTNAMWLYRSIDAGVTSTYREQEVYELRNTVVALSRLSSHYMQGLPKADVIPVLAKIFSTEKPYEKEQALHTTWLAIALSTDGKVIAVNQPNSTSESP